MAYESQQWKVDLPLLLELKFHLLTWQGYHVLDVIGAQHGTNIMLPENVEGPEIIKLGKEKVTYTISDRRV